MPPVQASATFDMWRRWPSAPTDAPDEPGPERGNPWLVVLAVGIAVVVLGLVVIGLKVAAGTEPINPGGRGRQSRTEAQEQVARNAIAQTCQYPGPVTLTLIAYEAVHDDPSISDHWTFSVATRTGYAHNASVFRETNGGYIVGCFD